MAYILGLLAVLLTTGGQVLLKKATLVSEKKMSYILMAIGYFFFLITIFFSYMLMKLIAMKYFTIIMSLNYIVVMIFAKIFLNEALEKRKIIGTLLVTIGIFIFMLEPSADSF